LHVLDGDPRVAVLVLVAALDYHLSQPAERRESIDEVQAMLALLERAADSIVARR